MDSDRDRFCHNCGEPLGLPGYPKTCTKCGVMIWTNPIPVAVCVQPIVNRIHWSDRRGLAIARRAIEPRLGTWNFLGGHLEQGETFEDAAHREFLEETSMCSSPGYNPRITGSYQNGHGHVLVAVEFDPIDIEWWRKAKLCPENSEFGILWQDEFNINSLGFPIHQTIAQAWFEGWKK